MSNIYPIATLQQMAAIPAEARGRFLAEMPAILEMAASLAAMASAVGAEYRLDDSDPPTWIDDGKTDATVRTKVQDVDGNTIATSFTEFKGPCA